MPLNKRMSDSIHAAASTVLQDGETVQVVTSATVGQVSAKKFVGVAVGVAVLSGGALTAFVRPKKYAMAMTDRRLLFFDGNILTGHATSTLALEVPRHGLATASVRTKRVVLVVPTLEVELAVGGSEKGLRLQFPTPCRAEGQQIADALRQAAPTA